MAKVFTYLSLLLQALGDLIEAIVQTGQNLSRVARTFFFTRIDQSSGLGTIPRKVCN
jgi:hypothetical protein